MVLEFQCDALKVKQERLKEINRDLGLKLQSEKKEFEIENEDVKNQLMLASRRMMLLEREISRLKRVIKDSEDKGVSDGGTDFEFAQKNIRHLLTLKADEQNMMIREIEALKKSLRDRDDIITTMKLENANLRRELATVSHELKWVSELKVRSTPNQFA